MNNLSFHTIEPYDRKFIIATVENDKQAKYLVDKFLIDDVSIKRLGGVYSVSHEGWNSILVFFNFNSFQTITYGIVAHEALHIVDEIFRCIDYDYNGENNEVGAYLIEWIVNQIFNHIEERNLLKHLSHKSKIKNVHKIISKLISKKE